MYILEYHQIGALKSNPVPDFLFVTSRRFATLSNKTVDWCVQGPRRSARVTSDSWATHAHEI